MISYRQTNNSFSYEQRILDVAMLNGAVTRNLEPYLPFL